MKGAARAGREAESRSRYRINPEHLIQRLDQLFEADSGASRHRRDALRIPLVNLTENALGDSLFVQIASGKQVYFVQHQDLPRLLRADFGKYLEHMRSLF